MTSYRMAAGYKNMHVFESMLMLLVNFFINALNDIAG